MGAILGGKVPEYTPPPVVTPPPAATPPIMASSMTKQVGAAQRAKAGAAYGGTLSNEGGAGGLKEQTRTAPATLLG